MKLTDEQKQYIIDNIICIGDSWYYRSTWYHNEYDAYIDAKEHEWVLEKLDTPQLTDGGRMDYVVHIELHNNNYVLSDNYLPKEVGEELLTLFTANIDIQDTEFDEDNLNEAKKKKRKRSNIFHFFENPKHSLDMLNHDLTPVSSSDNIIGD